MLSLKIEGKNIHQCDVRKCFSFVWDFMLYFRRLHTQGLWDELFGVHWFAAETLPKYTLSNLVFSFYDVLWSRFEDQDFLNPELWQQWPNLGPVEMCQDRAGSGFLFRLLFFRNRCAAELDVAAARRVSLAHLRPWVNQAGVLKEWRGSGSDRCPCSNGNQQFLCFF